MTSINPQQIDALLPQTQCGLCGYKGCLPYATALASGEATINLCPPGGVDGLKALGALLNKDPAPYLDEMQQKSKPFLKAVIREAECIGCTKCIQACPVDAILGASKQMHTVISNECTGCELCVAPCPVDCIDILPTTDNLIDRKQQFKQRFEAREMRLAPEHADKNPVIADKRAYLQAMMLRVKSKK